MSRSYKKTPVMNTGNCMNPGISMMSLYFGPEMMLRKAVSLMFGKNGIIANNRSSNDR